MAKVNDLRANRQVCDIILYNYATKKPWLNIDFANSTGINLSGESVHAMAKGRKRISFQDPMDNTMTLEFQCFPFKLLSLFSDGTIKTDAVVSIRETVTVKAGQSSDIIATLTGPTSGTVVEGSVYAFPAGSFGETDSAYSSVAITSDPDSSTPPVTTWTATFTGDKKPTAGDSVEIVYMVKKTSGVKRIAINDDMLAIDVAMEMKTMNKTESGTYVPLLIKIYKATVQRNFELTFASEGDPASISMTFDVLDTDDGNIEIVELTDEEA